MSSLRLFATALFAVSVSLTASALAQSGGAQPAEPQKPAAAAPANAAESAAKDGQKRIDEIAEATKTLVGPAGNPECVWLGRRVVGLLWRDDLDTAFRHLDLYDRFGCPSAHIQATFRCIVRQGNIDPKQPEALGVRVHACWINPGLTPAPAAAASNTPAAGGTEGTTTKQ